MSAKNRVSPTEEDAGMARQTYDMGKAAEAGIVEPSGTKGQYKVTDSKTAAMAEGGKDDNGSDKGNEEEKDKDEIGPMVGVGQLFRFATSKDRWLMILGTLGALFQGAALPLMIIIFGDMTDMFIDDAMMDNWLDEHMDNITMFFPNATRESIRDTPEQIIDFLIDNNMTEIADSLADRLIGNLLDDMRMYAKWYAGLGGIVLVVAYIQIACWQTASLNQSQRIREKLFQCILKQDIGWFDTHESGELNTRLSDDINKIEVGMGDKLSMVFQYISGFITGFVIGFIWGWQLTLVILAVSPLMIASGAVMAQLGSKLTTQGLNAYAKAGSVAEEVLGSMRTVTAFGGQEKEVARYTEHLVDARDFGVKKGFINGATMGLVFLVMFCCYGLGFWYGSKLVRENDDYTGGTVLIVFFSVIIAAFSIGNAGPYLQDFSKARGAAHAIWAIIDLQPEIDSSSPDGKKIANFKGNIEFKNVKFRYPSREDVPVLEGLNLKVDVGQTVALVGQSGCGKSTTVSLIQRFYDVLEGEVLLDGVNVKELNVKWLRNQIGVVSQEPILFGKTIRENIALGKDNVTDAEIEKAVKEANAYDFIMKLPKKYDTMVGERGAALSGGQKQRIAISRALVRDPKVLLLDEATSALDTESEAVVQGALEKASQGRTTLVIAHRLSTVRNADQIAGITNGKVVELGNHDELMKHQGIYYTLCTNQSQNMEALDEAMQASKAPRKDSVGSAKHKLEKSLSTPGKTGKKGAAAKDVPEEEEEEDLPEASVGRIMRMNSPEGVLIAIGTFAAIIFGCIQPAFAIIFAEILGVFSNLDMEEQERQANMYSVLFVIIGIVAGISMLVMSYCLGRSGEYLTMRVRHLTFKALLRQDIAFFDESKHSTGALCARLATDASAVEGATGARLSTLFQAISAMAAGIIIGFVFSWELTLLIIAFAPFMMLSGFIEMQMYTGNKGDRKSSEEAGKIATESIENIRTVAQLTKEDQFTEDYSVAIREPYTQNRKKAQVHAVAWATSQAVVFWAYAACFTMGAWLIQESRLNYIDMFKVFSAIVFSAMSVGQATSFAPDYGKAKTSAAKIFQLLDRVPEIDSYSEEGSKPANFTGKVELSAVEFVYPTRETVPVLRGIDIEVPPGKVIALVGTSGCGKSTVVSLVERFYDVKAGNVKLDGHDIRELHVQYFRSKIGIVSQEPILFDASIRDNIAYGDNSRQVPMDEIIAAAKNANIHNFIETLPLGYDTNVGDKGTQLSGGQKQRVAIARALVRDPKILLLDEATSALDTESEKVVQEALDRAQEGRTSIVIAHRLSTIQNADRIYVINNGEVSEYGTHSELLQQGGIYYRMNTAQLKTQT